ncbi:MAG TPA: uracil phosphoribosyltransferase [Aquificaceae bacterium]|nr:uracil phosphoribosyltransferase [Aquificaceae bacterium]
MPLKVLDNPLLKHKLNTIRDKRNPPERLRSLVEELTLMCMPYLMEEAPIRNERIETPLEESIFEFVEEEKIVLLCILRAGMPMLNGALRAFPRAKAGFLAIRRNEESLKPTLYYRRIPNIKDKWVVVLDPMLATGGTLSMALEEIKAERPERIFSLNLVASPEGIEKVLSLHPDVNLFVVSVDRELNQKGYIVPGVGDMGDRLFSEYP